MKRLVLTGLCVLLAAGTALADWDVGCSGCELEKQYPYHEIGDDALIIDSDICFWTLENENCSADEEMVANVPPAYEFAEQGQIQVDVPDIEDVCIRDEAGMYGHVFSTVADKYETSWDVNSVNSNAAYADGAWQELLDRWIRL